MSDLLGDASQWLGEVLAEHAAVTVTYRRSGLDPVEVTATPGETRYEVVRENGKPVEVEARDWLIDDAELAGLGMPPQRRDEIDVERDGATYTYQVTPAVSGEPCWRWSDRYHRRRRIHTQLIQES